METIANNAVLYTCNLLRQKILSVLTITKKKKKMELYEMMDVLTNYIVVIISHHICISNHYVVHLKFTQFYYLIIAQ